MGRKFKREWTYVYLWLIHVDVWQKKKTQYYKAVILQLELKNKQKMVEMVGFMLFIFATMRERC